jgi:acetate kinase
VAGVSAARLLIVNAGSSSLKLRVLDGGDRVTATLDIQGDRDWDERLEDFLGEVEVDAAVHRVVHGGEEFAGPAAIDARLKLRVAELAELAPLHNRPALRMIEALEALRPGLPAVACFDTAFHRTLPAAAATYALPAEWAERWTLPRFGFHGLSHSYAARRAGELLEDGTELRIVIAHLGAGASLAAVRGGRSVDTTMGFTPMEGLVMATRSGSLDPGLLLWVQRHGGLGPERAEQALDREAGLLGLSARSDRYEELFEAAEAGDDRSALALDVYLHRLRSGIAAMAAAMDGMDALVFTAGVGENSAHARTGACRGLGFLGIELDEDLNAQPPGDTRLDRGGAVAVLRIEAREDLEMARQARPLLG